jgi:hypothetical protein
VEHLRSLLLPTLSKVEYFEVRCFIQTIVLPLIWSHDRTLDIVNSIMLWAIGACTWQRFLLSLGSHRCRNRAHHYVSFTE